MSLQQQPMTNNKHKSQALASAMSKLRTETFDPSNDEHIEAFTMLVHGGRMHPTLRFTLEQPYVDVRAMMTDKIIRIYLDGRTPQNS